MQSLYKKVKRPEDKTSGERLFARLKGEEYLAKSISTDKVAEDEKGLYTHWLVEVGNARMEVKIQWFRENFAVYEMMEMCSESHKVPIAGTNKVMRFKGTKIHRIAKDYLEGGDILNRDGTGFIAV